MKRYYAKVVAGEIVERRMYDTISAPAGFTEITKTQYDSIHNPTFKYTYSGGTVTHAGDRPFVWDGVPDSIGPGSGREDAYIDP